MRYLLVLLLVTIAPTSLYANPVFLQHRVHDPLNLLAAVPAASSPANDGLELQFSATRVNVFSGGRAGGATSDELLVLDGEISELEFRGQVALNGCYTAAFDTRLINHAGGSFDDEISAWHDIFALPDANRGESPSDALSYVYSNSGSIDDSVQGSDSSQVALSTPGTVLGEVWLSVQRPFSCDNQALIHRNLTGHIRIGVKVPVGKVEGWGSGGQPGFFTDWHSLPNQLSKHSRVTSTLGVSISGDWDPQFDALSPRKYIGYGAVVFDYQWNRHWQSLLQFDFRSPTFDSELTELGRWGAQVHVGVRAAFSTQHQFEISFSEDAAIDTAPDIGIRVAYTYKN